MTREKMITDNLGLVHSCCKHFKNRGIEYEDLFQAGSIGLIKAVDGFDETRGLKLSTYAVPVILGEIKRLFRDGGTVKVSRSLKELSLKISKVSTEIASELDREPTVKEIADKLSVSPEEVAEAICAAQPTVSLTYDCDGEENQLDLPVDSHESAVINKVSIDEILNRMPENDRKIIEYRYFKLYTQQKTANILGMTQVQVSRKEKTILAGIRKKLS